MLDNAANKLEELFSPLAKALGRLPEWLRYVIYGLCGLYVFVLLAEVCGSRWVYGYIFQAVQNSAGVIDSNLATALSILLTMVTYWAGPKVLWYWLSLDRKLAAISTTLLLGGWFVLLYVLSTVNSGYVFNPSTQEARYNYYRSPSGKIELFPRDFKFHPVLGVELKKVTPEVMEKVEKTPDINFSSKLVSKKSFRLSNFSVKNYSFDRSPEYVTLHSRKNHIWVEAIKEEAGETIIELGAGCWSGESCWLVKEDLTEGIYLTNTSGQVFQSTKNLAEFPGCWFIWCHHRELLEGEIYKFSISFELFRSEESPMTLHFKKYPEIRLYFKVK